MAKRELSFEAIGTVWHIELFDDVTDAQIGVAKQKVLQRIDTFDRNYSRFREDSLVTQMAAEPGRYSLPADAMPLFEVYHKLYKATGGLMTPLIGQTLSDAGYDANYSLKPGNVSRPPKWEDTIEYDAQHVLLHQPALLDFGAAGKGYLADIVAGVLTIEGMNNFAINAGGDIVFRTSSKKFLQIGLEHPNDRKLAVGVAKILNQSLCGSAHSRRKWDKYSHIINPSTLESPRGIAALWVVADSGLIADGIATALFFVSPIRLRPYFNFEYALVRSDMSLHHSRGFPAEFYTK